MNDETCHDEQSGVYGADYAIGTYPLADDVVEWQLTNELAPIQISMPRDVALGPDLPYCDHCGPPRCLGRSAAASLPY